jgi:hypothetical protein
MLVQGHINYEVTKTSLNTRYKNNLLGQEFQPTARVHFWNAASLSMVKNVYPICYQETRFVNADTILHHMSLTATFSLMKKVKSRISTFITD